MLILDPAQRRALRSRAHHLQPVVTVGQHGLTPAVLHEIDVNLLAHELIKLRVFSDARASRDELLAQVCAELGATPVQHLGKVLVIYRPRPAEATEAPAPVRRAPRPKPAGAARKRPAASAPATPGSGRAGTPGAAARKPRVQRPQPHTSSPRAGARKPVAQGARTDASGPGRGEAKAPGRRRPLSSAAEAGAFGKRTPRPTPAAHGKPRPPSAKTSKRERDEGARGSGQTPAPRQRRPAGQKEERQAATPAAARSRRRRG
ncbi:MAG: YhbY family RNA-binding protein [Casimicrobiaceae bacterium]